MLNQFIRVDVRLL